MNSKQFIASGIIEAYCLGVATAKQITEVLLMSVFYEDVKEEIAVIEDAIQKVKCKEAFLDGNQKKSN